MQQWRLSRLCAERIHLVSVHLWSVRVTGSKIRGGNMNEIMFFSLSILSVCCSAFIQGFLTLAEAGQRSTFTFILFPPFKEKKQACVFPLTYLPVSSGAGARTVLWKWLRGLDNLLFSLAFTIPWHSQSVAGGLYLRFPPPMRAGWLIWDGKRKRRKMVWSDVGMGMILVSLLVRLLGQRGSWWFCRIARRRQGSREPRWVLRST